MNHDYAHCLDQDKRCPETCFRRQLNDDLRKNPTVVPYGIASWMHFRETGLCQIEKEESDAE